MKRIIMTTSSEPAEKRCSTCGDSYPATNDFFNRNNAMSDKLANECKPCRRNRRLVEKILRKKNGSPPPARKMVLEALAEAEEAF